MGKMHLVRLPHLRHILLPWTAIYSATWKQRGSPMGWLCSSLLVAASSRSPNRGYAPPLTCALRVLTPVVRQILGPLIPQLTSTPLITSHDLPPLIAHNPTLAHPILVALLSQPAIDTYLDVLRHLPPTLPTFDLLGHLLRDSTVVTDHTTGGRTTVADLVRSEVLGWFLHQSIQWLDRTEEEERAGVISDDRFMQGVQNVRPYFRPLTSMS